MAAATLARGGAASASLAMRGKQTSERNSFTGDDAADDKWQSFKMAKVAGTESDLYRIAKVAGVADDLQHETVKIDYMMYKWTPKSVSGRAGADEWQLRRVVMTTEEILFFKPGLPTIVDRIPLHGVSRSYVGTNQDHRRDLVHRERAKIGAIRDAGDSAAPTTPVNREGRYSIRARHLMPTVGKMAPHAHELQTKHTSTEPVGEAGERCSAAMGTAARKERGEGLPGSEEREENDTRDFVIETLKDSYNDGKTYYVRARTEVESKKFLRMLQELEKDSKLSYRRKRRIETTQKWLRSCYSNPFFQSFVALVIFANFVASMLELQLRPNGAQLEMFRMIDVVFALIFVIELLLNMAGNWFWRFWRSSFNIFDLAVVIITTISLMPSIDMRVISTLRLLRAFRVVRIFSRLQSAKKIITALSASAVPVLNVLVVVVGMMCVFAMFGATAYARSSRFSTFSDAMFSCFQALCLDGWSLILMDVESEQPDQTVPAKMFFVVYIFCIVYILMPVFVAAILDGYRTASYLQTEETKREKHMSAGRDGTNNLTMAVDPVLQSLCACSTTIHVENKLDLLFDVIDVDESGFVSFEELRSSLDKINLLSRELTMDEFEIISGSGHFVSKNGEFTRQLFKAAFMEQLRLYLQRKLAQYILAVQDDPIHEMIFIALKGILTNQASLTNELNHPLTARMAAMEQNQEAMMEKMDFLAQKIGAIASASPAVVVEAKASRRDGGKAGCGQKEAEDDASWLASRKESLSASSVGLIMEDEPPGNGRAGSPVSVFQLEYVDQ